MDWLKKEEWKCGIKEGVVFGDEESVFSGRQISLAVSKAVKQLLQIQKGEQGESSQGSDFCSVSILFWYSIPNSWFANTTMPPPPSPQGASDSAKM